MLRTIEPLVHTYNSSPEEYILSSPSYVRPDTREAQLESRASAAIERTNRTYEDFVWTAAGF